VNTTGILYSTPADKEVWEDRKTTDRKRGERERVNRKLAVGCFTEPSKSWLSCVMINWIVPFTVVKELASIH
jgi:hypothetical protein